MPITLERIGRSPGFAQLPFLRSCGQLALSGGQLTLGCGQLGAHIRRQSSTAGSLLVLCTQAGRFGLLILHSALEWVTYPSTYIG